MYRRSLAFLPRLLSLIAALTLSLPAFASGGSGFADNNFDGAAQDEFLPVEEAYRLDLLFNDDGSLLLHWEIAEGYYLYRHGFEIALANTAGPVDLTPDIAPGIEKTDDYFGQVQVYYDQAEITLPALPETGVYQLTVTSQGCADAGLCYPPHDEHFRLDLERQSITRTAVAAPGLPQNPKTPSPPPSAPASAKSVLYMAVLALLGGIILNLMPCVFPVLSLKVLSFANDGDHKQWVHGLSYTAGLVISFVIVAGILIGLQAAGNAVGWGFHLQSPWFVGALAYLFFTMGLSLSGAVHFGGGLMNLGGSLAVKRGYAGSFFTGMLACVVASPCTAPFMGTALGFAVTQPAPVALGIFACLGLGMALPILLLCLSPRLLRYMPKPGPWMERFKQILAFPLYATAVWLCWVVGKQAGVNGMALLLLGLVLIALVLWLWPQGQVGKSLGAAGAALALALLANPMLNANSGNQPALESNGQWQPYHPDTLAELRAQGVPVFVNITADWCITCLANEKVTLSSDVVKAAFRAKGVSYLKGDWTNYDPMITDLLRHYERTGIPLYLVFPADPDQDAVILPQLLTKEIVIEAIDNA